ncbi:unnamed protein product, partial [Vitis vinifera]
MGFEQLSSSALPSLGFSCLNFLSNQTEICIHISLSLTSGSVFFCFCWVQFRWMNAWLDYKSFSTQLQVEQRSYLGRTVKGDTILCNEVKSINADSSPGPEVYNALLFFGIEYENL